MVRILEKERNVVYLMEAQQKLLNKPSVTIKDICEIQCENKRYEREIGDLKLYTFIVPDKKRTYKKIVSIIDIIKCIHSSYPTVHVVNYGQDSTLIEFSYQQTPGMVVQTIKTIIVSLLVFFGSAFTIMAFNNDISILGVFERCYEQMTGSKKPTVSIIEISYSIGLSLGIIVFFNHIGTKKLTDDVTPIEVEMNKHQKDTYTTIIDLSNERGTQKEND